MIPTFQKKIWHSCFLFPSPSSSRWGGCRDEDVSQGWGYTVRVILHYMNGRPQPCAQSHGGLRGLPVKAVPDWVQVEDQDPLPILPLVVQQRCFLNVQQLHHGKHRVSCFLSSILSGWKQGFLSLNLTGIVAFQYFQEAALGWLEIAVCENGYFLRCQFKVH